MTLQETEKLMTKIAVMHHIEQIPQRDIAARLGISGSRVSRMLSRARDEGIVRTYVYSPLTTICALEAEIERAFALKEAVIVSGGDDNETAGALALAGAEVMQRAIKPRDVLGVSFSHPLSAAVNQLQGNDIDGIRVVQLMGVRSEDQGSLDIVQRLGRIYGTSPQVLYCPGAVATQELRDSLALEPAISSALELAAQADVAVLGIGDMSPVSQVFRDHYLNEEMRQKLIERGAAGYICMHFYDKDGSICDEEFDRRVMSVSLEQLKAIPTVISIASGQRKVKAIAAALRGGLIDTLVTDEITARAILAQQ